MSNTGELLTKGAINAEPRRLRQYISKAGWILANTGILFSFG
jgi:hypothetical protein